MDCPLREVYSELKLLVFSKMTAESEPFVIHSTSNVYPPLPTSNGEKKDLKPYEVTFTPPNDHDKGMLLVLYHLCL